MVILREMREDEFPSYCRYFIKDYSEEIIVNYGHNEEYALDLAQKDLLRFFPDGPGSKGQSLLCVEAEIEGQFKSVGYLWHSINSDDHSTFIYDFYIFSEYRGRGFGKESMIILEKQMKDAGIKQIKLRVAFHNDRALKLYKDAGFTLTGYNLSRNI